MHILLNPGPVNISDRVRNALAKPDMCHREEEFSFLQQGIRKKILDLYQLPDDWAAVLLTGSGTAAMEAMVSSLAGRDDHFLILENGVYGERLRTIADIHGIRYTSQKHPWGGEIDLTLLKSNLSQDITAIVMVHHETTTGRLNRLQAVSEIAGEYQIPILLDGVSSFGAEEIRFAEWNIKACAATANKCLHGVPGISFVVLDRKFLKSMNNGKNSLYLDLANYLHHQDQGGTPFTQSIQVMYALDEALSEHAEEGGWRSRQQSYRNKMNVLLEGLTSMGIKPYLDPKESSCVLQSFNLPEGIGYKAFHDKLKQQGFVIYSGQGKLAEAIFRVSLMGVITEEDTQRFVEAVRKVTTD